MRAPRPLVISHSADSTGAVIALLRIMRWCVHHGLLEPTFVVRDNGALAEEFRRLGPTFVLSQNAEVLLEKASERLPGGRTALTAARLGSTYWLRRLCRKHNIDLIYVNTAMQAPLVSSVTPLGLPIVTHIHELEGTMRMTVGLGAIKTIIGQSDLLIAVSGAVRKMLVVHGAEENRVVDVQEPVDEFPLLSGDERDRVRRNVLKVDDDAIVVAGCGLPSWRKGTDIFLRVAQHVVERQRLGTEVAFRWIGGCPPNEALTTLIDDTARLGLTRSIEAIGQVRAANRVIGAVDIFISPSREDPNPLVVLEAAAAARAVVCFRDAGGAEELADAGGAVAVPYLDAEAMATAVGTLVRSSQTRLVLGDTARQAVLERNATEVVGEQVAAAIGRVIG